MIQNASLTNTENAVGMTMAEQNGDTNVAQADEELLSLRRKHMPTTTL